MNEVLFQDTNARLATAWNTSHQFEVFGLVDGPEVGKPWRLGALLDVRTWFGPKGEAPTVSEAADLARRYMAEVMHDFGETEE